MAANESSSEMSDYILDLDDLSDEHRDVYVELSRDFRYEYNELIGGVVCDDHAGLGVLISSISSREPGYSQLFKRCCDIKFISYVLSSDRSVKKIVLSDYMVYEVVVESVVCGDCSVDFVGRSGVALFLGETYALIRNILRSIIIVFLSAFSGIAKGRRALPDGPIVLISTHILDAESKYSGSIGKYNDRYMPGLFDFLCGDFSNNVRFVPGFPGGPKNYYSLFKSIRRSGHPLLIKFDWLGIKDYIYAFYCSLMGLRATIPKVSVDGIEVNRLIKSEFVSHLFDYKIIESILNYRFVRALNCEGVKVSLFVDWYENQLSSKGYMFGFNSFMPDAELIGYHGIIDHSLWRMNLSPTVYESQLGLAPHRVIVTGDVLIDRMKEFDGALDVCVGPTFRYNYLWNIDDSPQAYRKSILISLPIDVERAIKILLVVSEAFDEINGSYKYEFNVKMHPTHGERHLRLISEYLHDSFVIVDSEFSKLIESSVLLISAASTTCMEVIAYGIPVIVVADKFIELNNPIPLSVSRSLYQLVYNSSDVAYAVNQYIGSGGTGAEKASMISFKKDYFCPVRKAYVEKIFGAGSYCDSTC